MAENLAEAYYTGRGNPAFTAFITIRQVNAFDSRSKLVYYAWLNQQHTRERTITQEKRQNKKNLTDKEQKHRAWIAKKGNTWIGDDDEASKPRSSSNISVKYVNKR